MTGRLPDRLAGDGLAGLWRRCWKAMARAGPEGWSLVTIRPPLTSDAERRAVGGLLGRAVRPGTASVRVELGDLDRLLRVAGDGWDLVAVVEEAVGTLPDRAGETRAQQDAIADARAGARAAAGRAVWVDDWLADLDRGMLARLYGRGELDLVVAAARILARLPVDDLPLPVLASTATGNTKALAGTTLEGLVLRGLALRHGEPQPQTAAERRGLWEAAGVVPDDLASQVLAVNLPVASDGPLGGWLVEAGAQGMPFRVTLHQLVRSPVRVGAPRPVFVCENPAVLRAAAERLGDASAPLVCTEGRPSVACQLLLATLRAGGCELRYHGDFDWPGLRIAAALIDAGAEPWRFGATDYTEAVVRLGAGRTSLRGPAATSPWDPDLAEAMVRHGAVVYEEDVLDSLLKDLSGT
jgi:uncharacterized protein (TIGR02679 family)